MGRKKQTTLERKLLRNFIRACIACFIVSGVVICFFTENILEKTMLSSARQEFVQNCSAIERHIDDYYYASYKIQNSTTVIEAMTREPVDNADPYYAKRQIEAQLNVLTGAMSLYPISLYLNETTLYRDNIIFHPISQLEKYDVFEEFRSKNQSYVWLPPEEVRFSDLGRDVEVISFLRKVGDNRNPIAFQKVTIRIKELEDLIALGEERECVFVYQQGTHKKLLQKGEDKIHEENINYEAIEPLIGKEQWSRLRIGGRPFWFYAETIKGTDWVMVTVLSRWALGPLFLGIVLVWAVTFLILTLIYVRFDRRYSNHIVERVRLLETHMGNVLHEELVPINYQDIEEKDELDFLIEYYNETLVKMKTLMTRQLEHEKEKRKLEQSLIQAQINPHFLYNTLDLIKWRALDANAPKIAEITCHLSDFYRLSLNSGRELVTVKDEIFHVRNYIELQSCRFGTEIQLTAELPADILESRIPKITLQPLVENAVQHGFLVKENRKECQIELYGWREEGAIVLMLQDNGIGMSEEEVKDILTRVPSSTLHGFGVRNIHERLRLYCQEGEDDEQATGEAERDCYGLKYESIPGEGTTVYIRFRDHL